MTGPGPPGAGATRAASRSPPSARSAASTGRATRPALLVVDEAHYVKNPNAKRSQAVNRIAAECDRVLFLTGTADGEPGRRVRALVGHLRPDVAATMERAAPGGRAPTRSAGPPRPVYLRRNQQDVLTELPELVQVDEWEEFGAAGRGGVPRRRSATGNFMAMRRAAFAGERPAALGQAEPAAGDHVARRRRTGARWSCSRTSATCSMPCRPRSAPTHVGPHHRSTVDRRAAAHRRRVHRRRPSRSCWCARSRRAGSG